MLLVSIAKLLELVAPIAAIKATWINIQFIFTTIALLGLICFLVVIFYERKLSRNKFIFLVAVLFITAALSWVYYDKISQIASVYVIIVMSLSVNLIVFFNRNNIFPEIERSLDHIIKAFRESVAIFDTQGSLVDMKLLGLQGSVIAFDTKTMASFVEQINSASKELSLEIHCIQSLKNEAYEKEIKIERNDVVNYYVFNASIINNKRAKKVGTVFTISEITESKLISMALNEKYFELQNLNLELGNYMNIVDSLEVEKERTQIAREINSTVGQKLTEILSVLEVIKLTQKEEALVFDKPLNEAIESCREVLSEIRVVVSKLIPDKER